MDDKPTIIYGRHYITIHHNGDELVYWDQNEWIEDPEVVFAIAGAIEYAMVHGATALKVKLERAGRKHETCGMCERAKAQPEHTCPYNVELGDGKKLCNCCAACEGQCAADI